MVRKEMIVRNKMGLHARPAALFVQLANKFEAEITVQKDDEEVNGKSIMGIMMLAATQGSKIYIIAKGEDAQQAVEELSKLVMSEE
ncbi:MAG: HPr family phosphocarrier protein [Candidatus Omnitrophota bacterium]